MLELKLATETTPEQIKAFKAGQAYREMFESRAIGEYGAVMYAGDEDDLYEKFLAGFDSI